jgi:hypothetical protein
VLRQGSLLERRGMRNSVSPAGIIYVECNSHRLHLWKPKHATIPMLPKVLASHGFDPALIEKR